MRPEVFTLLAMLLYAMLNLVLEQKLSRYHTAAVLFYCYLAMFPLAVARLIHLKATEKGSAFPTGGAIAVVLLVGVIYFFADYSYIAAYTHGGNLFNITTIAILLPVVASVGKFLVSGELPNAWQLGGYAFASVGVLLVIKGSA